MTDIFMAMAASERKDGCESPAAGERSGGGQQGWSTVWSPLARNGYGDSAAPRQEVVCLPLVLVRCRLLSCYHSCLT